jgi:Galactose oxidase, central domain
MRMWFSIGVVLIVACKFDARVPKGALVGCDVNEDCPNATFCVGFGRCAQRDVYFSSLADRVSPSTIGPTQRVTIHLVPLSQLTDAPIVFGVTATKRTEARLVSSESDGFRYEWFVDAEDFSNEVLFLANVESLGASNIDLGSVKIDREGPVLELRSKSLTPKAEVAELLGTRLRDIALLSNGMTVEVELSANEALLEAPAVMLGELVLAAQVRDGQLYRFRGEMEGLVDGAEMPLSASTTDAHGNESKSVLLTFRVDTVAPAAPSVNVPRSIVFGRAPAGTLDSPGVPTFSLRAQAGALEPKSLLLVSSPVGQIATLGAAADGSLPESPLPLGADLTQVSVRSVDAAGNISVPVAVKDTELTTYLDARAVPYQRQYDSNSFGSFEAHNEAQAATDAGVPFVIRSVAQPYRERLIEPMFATANVVERGGLGLVTSSPTACSTSSRTNVIQWSDTSFYGEAKYCGDGRKEIVTQHGGRRVDVLLDPRGATGTEYSPLLAFFVGSFGMGIEVYQGASTVYRELNKVGARRLHAAAYDFARSQVVVFGGEGLDGKLLNDTWIYSRQGQLVQLPPQAGGPVARKRAAMLYNPLSGQVVMHGGNDGTRSLDDFWGFDGKAWVRIPSAKPAVAREGHQLGYFAAHGLVLVGGSVNGQPPPGMLLWNDGWFEPASFSKTFALPKDCDPNVEDYVLPSAQGTGFLCRKLAATRFTHITPDGKQQVIDTPPYLASTLPTAERNFEHVAYTTGLGLVTYFSEGVGMVMQRLVGEKWEPTPFKGSCNVSEGVFACADNDAVRFSNGVTATFPVGTAPATQMAIWNESAETWVVHRATAAGEVTRYRASSKGTLQALSGRPFRKVERVWFSGAPKGQPVVYLQEDALTTLGYVEVLADGQWIEGGYKFSLSRFPVVSVKAPDGSTYAFEAGQFGFQQPSPFAETSFGWLKLVTSGIRPSLRVLIPRVAGCDNPTRVEFSADADGVAGGTPGVVISPSNSRDYKPSPAFQIEPSVSRPKTVVNDPQALLRFGFVPTPPEVTDTDFRNWDVLISTVGKTKGATDGVVNLRAFQMKYDCAAME